MSKLSYIDGLKLSDVNGYKLQRVILIVPIIFTGIEGTFQGKISFWTGYNCQLNLYTTYSSGTVEDVEATSEGAIVPLGTYYYFGLPTGLTSADVRSLLYYIANQDPYNPGHVIDVEPIELDVTQNKATIIYSYSQQNSNQFSWINKVWNASFGPMTFDVTFEEKFRYKKQALILAYYDADGVQTTDYVKFVSCTGVSPSSALGKNQITLEIFYYQIYISFFDGIERQELIKKENKKLIKNNK